eukprot:CAMPEP_0177668046 /NCGR_PEP_ID=MMETSP0447-20121125/22501_1 /TAXON_ID=0 /ORGANISM="Stygamoeba regulata, Strain BSH-02190019" /LENGTH=117 /DNA_ID=CAMNT_0019174425 /DNA_START=255 /DNA_END=604 /DNA_ORIENTATION=-
MGEKLCATKLGLEVPHQYGSFFTRGVSAAPRADTPEEALRIVKEVSSWVRPPLLPPLTLEELSKGPKDSKADSKNKGVAHDTTLVSPSLTNKKPSAADRSSGPGSSEKAESKVDSVG